MILWLILSTPIVLILLVLLSNQANLTQTPGVMPRLKLFLRTNVAEINLQPVLPELKSPRFKLSAQELFNRVSTTVESLGWTIEYSDAQKQSLHAVVTTSLWKFKDDIKITAVADGDTSYLQATSGSRVGKGDLAANSHHLQQLLEAVDQ